MDLLQNELERKTNPPSVSKPSFFNRNLFAFAITLVSLVFALTIFYFEVQLRKEVENDVFQSLDRLAELGDDALTDQFEHYRRNLSFLHATPPVPGIPRALENNGVDPIDGTLFQQWRDQLETIFIAMLQNNPEIDQLRIISAQPGGMELVRVDRLSGRISAIDDAELQLKGDTSYFAEAMNLAPNESYISPLSLNQERGEIEFPYRPTVRLLMPIFYDSGERFGFIIMNIQASFMIQAIRDLVDSEFSAILIDHEGYFIDHPEEDYRFSRDLNTEYTWTDVYRLTQYVQRNRGIATELATNTDDYYAETDVVYASGDENFITIIVTAPDEYASALMQQRRITLYGYMLVVYLVLLALLLFVKRSYRSSIALAETRAEHEAIINSSFDAIIGIDLKGVITSWNRTASELFHRSSVEAVGNTFESLLLFKELNIDKEIEKLSQDKTMVAFDYQFSDHRTEPKSLAITLNRIELNDFTLSGVALIARDVTLQKQAESRIKQINVELETQVAERTKELNIAHQKVVKSSAFKSAFISSVSHEMRTPLNGMIGTLNLVKRSPMNPEQEKYINMAETSTRTLSKLINDILDLSKIEAGKLDFESKPFDPRHVIELTAASTSLPAHEKGLEFILDTSDIVHSRVSGDSNRLKQILHNLIGNAVKFTSWGEIRIYAKTRLTEEQKIELTVEITDTGIGIEEVNQGKLFRAFTQADSNISGKFGGTGLGLSICKQLCRLMGGDIKVVSEFGKGSTFSFQVYFDSKQSQIETITPILKNKHIGIAVNNPNLFSAMQRLLVKYGATTDSKWLPAERYIDSISENEALQFVFTDYSAVALDTLRVEVSKRLASPPCLVLLHTSTTLQADSSNTEVSISLPALHDDVLRTLDKEYSLSHKRPQTSYPDLSSFEKLPNAVVLVVDDNDINLEVACGLLQPLEVQFKTAKNGQQALDVLNQARRDGEVIHCLLMDCQMPVMTGYDCTRQIRDGAAGEEFRAIPIIAMTANALSGEREACLESGMSDYITKPLSYKHLLEKVSHWVKISEQDGSSQQPIENKGDSSTEDLITWDRDAAVARMLGNEALVNRISRMYLDSVDEKFGMLEQSVLAKNFDAIESDSHRLKGLSGDIGANRIHHIFSMLELAAEHREEKEIAPLLQEAKQELHILTKTINDFLATIETSAT